MRGGFPLFRKLHFCCEICGPEQWRKHDVLQDMIDVHGEPPSTPAKVWKEHDRYVSNYDRIREQFVRHSSLLHELAGLGVPDEEDEKDKRRRAEDRSAAKAYDFFLREKSNSCNTLYTDQFLQLFEPADTLLTAAEVQNLPDLLQGMLRERISVDKILNLLLLTEGFTLGGP